MCNSNKFVRLFSNNNYKKAIHFKTCRQTLVSERKCSASFLNRASAIKSFLCNCDLKTQTKIIISSCCGIGKEAFCLCPLCLCHFWLSRRKFTFSTFGEESFSHFSGSFSHARSISPQTSKHIVSYLNSAVLATYKWELRASFLK